MPQQPFYDEISLQSYKPSKTLIDAALGHSEQVVPGGQSLLTSNNQQRGNGGIVSGWKPPGKPNFPNQQPVQSWRNPFHPNRVS